MKKKKKVDELFEIVWSNCMKQNARLPTVCCLSCTKKKWSKGNTCVCSSVQKKHSQDELDTKEPG